MLLSKALRLVKSSHNKVIRALSTVYHQRNVLVHSSCPLHHMSKLPEHRVGPFLQSQRQFVSESSDSGQAHDTHERAESITDDDLKTEVLDNALKYVTSYGWTREALAMSANELGYPSVAEGLVLRGGPDLVLHFIRSSNDDLVRYMETIKAREGFKVSAFVRTVLEYRLRMLAPYISVWPQAMAILLQPSIVAESSEELGKMVDDIWFHAGDTSTDFNWYTKRGLVAKIFVSSQFVMVKDQSPDFIDTWEFLDRRLKDVAAFGKLSNTVQEQGRLVADIGVAGFTVLSNIIGIGERRR